VYGLHPGRFNQTNSCQTVLESGVPVTVRVRSCVNSRRLAWNGSEFSSSSEPKQVLMDEGGRIRHCCGFIAPPRSSLRLKKRLSDIGHGGDVNPQRRHGYQTSFPIHIDILQGQNVKCCNASLCVANAARISH
jgi:hypothetical protein